MERSEPSLVPEWLRSNSSHHVSSSKTDAPLLALPKRNTTSFVDSSPLEHTSSSTISRRTSSTNGYTKHNTIPYARSYSGPARNHRPKDRDNSHTWDSHYSDPLPPIITRTTHKDTLRRSHSMISRRPDDHRSFIDSRNRILNINGNGNAHGTIALATSPTPTHKVSFERDFPLLGTDDRPLTPDLTRLPSPGLSRAVQGLSTGTSPFIAGEGWTSALADVPLVTSNNIASSSSSHPAPSGGTPSAPTSSEPGATSGLNMAEALVQGPVRPQNVPQQSVSTQRFEELPSVGIKKLIPMTSSMPKSSMLNPSDKLKPKTATRSNEGVASPKNGLQQLPSLQLGNQAAGRGGSGRSDGSGSSKLQLLKPGREKVVSTALKDAPAQTFKVSNAVPNVQSTGSPTTASHVSKNPSNLKHFSNERKTAGYSLNGVQVVDKRLSHAHLQSRNDFFNLVRKKSMGSTSSADTDSSAVISPAVQNSGEEKEMASAENGSKVICNGDVHNLTESFSDQRRGSDLIPHELIHPKEELDFLRALGWEDEGDDDEGLTEEEINAFVQKYMKWRPDSKLLQGLQLKMMAESSSPASCSTGASSELRTADSSL